MKFGIACTLVLAAFVAAACVDGGDPPVRTAWVPPFGSVPPVGPDRPCGGGGGGGTLGSFEVAWARSHDDARMAFDLAVIGRNVPRRDAPGYRPAAFRVPGPGITGASIGRWFAGIDREGTVWLHHESRPAVAGNVYLVEPAEVPDSGLVVVEMLLRDLNFGFDGCKPGADVDSLMAFLDRDPIVREFAGGPLVSR